jgi:hypothetical protein
MCLQGCPKGLVALLVYFILYHNNIVSVYFYNAHQVLAGLPQGVGGLANFF